jgi:hypothetical protein
LDFVSQIDPSELAAKEIVAESDQFAVYAVGNDTYMIVQRHGGSPWTGVRLSGDGIFRVGGLIVDAMRHLYRDVARDLSPDRRGISERG